MSRGATHMQQRLKRTAKTGWRKIRKYLPDGVAKAISGPAKRVLRRAGLMQTRPRPARPATTVRTRG